MPKYRVVYTVDATASVTVEAENEQQAREKAEASADMVAPGLCWECSSKIDLGDALEIIDAIAVRA